MNTNIFNYHCLGCTCGASKNEKIFHIQKEVGENYLLPLSEEEQCPNSTELHPLKLMGSVSSTGYMKVDSMSHDQKATYMKQRSTDHYNKKLKERADAVDRGEHKIKSLGQ